MEHPFRLYSDIASFWSPVSRGSIYQPWKNPIYSQPISPPVSNYTLIQLLSVGLRAKGDVAEFGVYKGGSAKLMADRINDKKLHLFDSFLGLPRISEHDVFWSEGTFNDTSAELVKEKFKNYDFVEVHEGLFQDTMPHFESLNFCFVHVDCDLYESVKCVTEFVFPRMSPGGLIVYDDYGDYNSQGAKLAVDEYFSEHGKDFIYLPTRQAVVFT